MTDTTDKEPVAGLSAASSCIRISIQSPPSSENMEALPFRPVYTHQCFENEFIDGWRPTLEAEKQSQQIHRSWTSSSDGECGDVGGGNNNEIADNLHKSYRYLHHPRDRPNVARLDVHILLAPSCDTCRVEIQTETNANAVDQNEPLPKKVKMVSFEGEEIIDNDQKNSQMDLKDVVEKISLATPPIASIWVNNIRRNELLPAAKGNGTIIKRNSSSTEKNENLVCLTKAIGQPLKTYHRKDKEFVITLDDGADPEVAKYHNSVQPLARWFIETADDVDISDTSRGTWKVMYLFQYHEPPSSTTSESARSLSLAGYITLLHVNSPFRKPRPGIIVRVCQALIFPPYHRAGHGSEMLKSLYDYADIQNDFGASSSGMEILQVNVEDPAPAFVALRDSVDYHRFLTLCNEDKMKMNYLQEHDVTNKQFFDPISDENVLSISERLKITKRQTHIVHEIYKLHQIESWKQNENNDHELIEQVETNYRLMVKKSIRTLRLEELGACPDGKEGQKVLLGQWFDETLLHYHRVLRSKG